MMPSRLTVDAGTAAAGDFKRRVTGGSSEPTNQLPPGVEARPRNGAAPPRARRLHERQEAGEIERIHHREMIEALADAPRRAGALLPVQFLLVEIGDERVGVALARIDGIEQAAKFGRQRVRPCQRGTR